MRIIIRLCFTLIFLLILTGIAYAAPKVLLDGNELHFEAAPVIENGRTLVTADLLPLIGAKVQFFTGEDNIITSKDKVVIILTLEGESYVNNEPIELDTPAKTVNGKAMLPLRFVCESFGYIVEWDDSTQTVKLTSSTSIDKNQEYPLSLFSSDDFSIECPADWVCTGGLPIENRDFSSGKIYAFLPPIDLNQIATGSNYSIYGYAMSVEIEDLEQGMTLDQYEKKYYAFIEENNPGLEIIKTNETTLGQLAAKELVYFYISNLEINNRVTEVYAMDSKIYRVQLLEFNDSRFDEDTFKRIINSFKIKN